MKPLLLSILVMLVLGACNDMDRQRRDKDYDASSLFADGKAMQPPEHAVARDQAIETAALARRPDISPALIERGRARYDIFCAPCHDAAGGGRGTIVARGFPRPPDLREPRLVAAPSRHIVDVITQGYGVMYAYADRIAPADRWAIAAFVRALQLRANVSVADLSDMDRQSLEQSGGP